MIAERAETRPALVSKPEISIEDHGPMLMVNFDYGGSSQGFGYIVDMEFVRRFIRACGVWELSKCAGRVVMVTGTHTKITRVEPMPFDEGRGEPFDIEMWATKAREQGK